MLVVAFNSTFRYLDGLSINNNQLHSYIDSLHPNELVMKDTSDHVSVPHLLHI
jgi:hypothetical protein